MLGRTINFLAFSTALAQLAHVMFPPPHRPHTAPPVARVRRGGPREIGPHNTSFRSLRRAVNTGGLVPQQPSMKEMRRHKWFRKTLASAEQRILVGQEAPSDHELVRRARWMQEAEHSDHLARAWNRSR